MKRFFIALLLLLSVCSYAYASEYDTYLDVYDLSFFEDNLDKDTYSYLQDLGVSNFDYKSISSLSLNDVKNIVIKLALGNIKLPLESSIIVLGYVLFSAFFRTFRLGENDSFSDVYSTISALIISATLLIKMRDTIVMSASSISIASNFVYAFVPVFCAIVISCGGGTTAFSTNTLLLSLAQGLSFISSTVFVPLINCFMAIGICSSISYQLRLDRLLSTLRKLITTAISFSSACFVSILSIKTAVASRADAIGLRSIRFAINSVVPVIGSAISEGLLSIQSYSSLIKSSVGIVGIIAITMVFLPSIISVVLWRFMLSICSVVCDTFGDNSVSLTINTFRDTMLLMNVILILSMVTTIISIGILIAARTI